MIDRDTLERYTIGDSGGRSVDFDLFPDVNSTKAIKQVEDGVEIAFIVAHAALVVADSLRLIHIGTS